MVGWILFLVFFGSAVAAEGVVDAFVALFGALGVDAVTAIITGGSFSSIVSGAGLADDGIMMFLGKDMGFVEKVALSVQLEQDWHALVEADEALTDEDERNRRYERWLLYKRGGQTYLWGDVTPVDVIEIGVSGGILWKAGTAGNLFDALLERFGSLVTPTADVIASVGVFL